MMQKFVILTLGTRGDVQPYVALAQGLQQQGHTVTIATGESFRELIESAALTFYPVALDLMYIATTPEGQAILNGGIKRLPKALKYAKEQIAPAYRQTLDDFWHASEGADVIIYHPKVFGAVDIAHQRGARPISMPPIPTAYPIREFPNIAISATANFGAFGNKLTYKLMKYAEKANMKQINAFRQETLGLPPRKASLYATEDAHGNLIPIIYPISPTLFSFVESWRDHVFVPGFFFRDETTLSLSPEMSTFLEQGTPPIVISFSSMPLTDPVHMSQLLIQSLEQCQQRAIFLLGNSHVKLPTHPDLFVAQQAPHQLLFPKAQGVIHHGGAGTTASALKAGVPQFIIPFTGDQPFWAHILEQQQLIPFIAKEKALTRTNLCQALRWMTEPEVISKAQQFGQQIAQEDGVGAACAYLIDRLSYS